MIVNEQRKVKLVNCCNAIYAPEYWGNNKIYGLDGLAYSNFKHNYKDHWGIERKMGKGYPVIVTHWMPLPNSPKKEQK